MTYDNCLCLTLPHIVRQFLSPSSLLQMALYIYFLWLIVQCIYVPHLLYSFLCLWHLGCFHILTIINSATFGGHASFWSITTNKASGGDGIPVGLFQILKDDAVKVLHSITQYASKFGKLSGGHRTGKCQFSFQSQRKAMPKNAQPTAQLHSSHTLVK